MGQAEARRYSQAGSSRDPPQQSDHVRGIPLWLAGTFP